MSVPVQSREAWLASIRASIEPVGECMEWQGYYLKGTTPLIYTPAGYAWAGNTKGNQSARSVLYALSAGERLPARTVIRPRCWNERCVHEDHFQLVPRKQQAREQSKRGELQTAKAYFAKLRSAQARAKLTTEQVAAIRDGAESTDAAARLNNVTPQTVRNIRRGRARPDVLPAASVFAWGRAA